MRARFPAALFFLILPLVAHAQQISLNDDEGLTGMNLRIGYTTAGTNYGADSNSQFTEFFLSQKGLYDFRFGQRYLNRFDDDAMSVSLGGGLYFPLDMKFDADADVAPGETLFPQQAYTGALSQGTDYFRTILKYRFADYRTADFHEGSGAVRIGSGKLFGVTGEAGIERQIASVTAVHHIFSGTLDARPVPFLGFTGFFTWMEKGFEARRPVEFLEYTARRYGGGVRFFMQGDQGLSVDVSQEKRSNGESIRAFTVATLIGF